MRIRIDVDVDAATAARRLGLILLACAVGAGAHVVTAEPEDFAANETLTADKLNGNFDDLHDRVLALEAADPNCPRGYAQAASPPNPANPESILCTKGVDEMVRIGVGQSAFWVDRYEASVWNSQSNPTEPQYGASSDNYPAEFPDTGQWTIPLYALSREGFPPSTRLTWFQAHQACATSGKRLPTHAQWLEAAFRTPDPGSSPGTNGVCVTSGGVTRNSGGGTNCQSWFGAEDMIGNVWERSSELSGVGNQTGATYNGASPYPTTGITGTFAGDFTYDDSYAFGPNGFTIGLTSAPEFGGASVDGGGAGIFSFAYSDSVLHVSPRVGFRCVIHR